MFFCCKCCVLSSRGLCDGLITRPEESYRLWCVVVCDQKSSRISRLKPSKGAVKNDMINDIDIFINCNWVVTRWQ